ncbi:MAG: outer membrane beta-barrel protein, partial [Bacteroidota bacterium]
GIGIKLRRIPQLNADAYKTLPDADAADLIEKLPTVVINDGKVQAQGEEVKQVLVDGQPFFGNDPQAALNSLPAEVIDKIQIFDQQSEQSQFSGFNDGEDAKTINIVTKSRMRNGQFGKLYAGYGTDGRYLGGGNINVFNKEQRMAFIGLANNINQQNFSNEDLLGVLSSTQQGGRTRRRGGRRGGNRNNNNLSGASASDFLVPQQGGITASNALGFNLTDKWGKRLQVTASYLFHQSSNNTKQLLTQQFFDAESLQERYTEENRLASTNTNHRFSGLFNYRINDKNTLVWRAQVSGQANDGAEDSFGQTLLNDQNLNQTEIDFATDLTALKLTNALLWRRNFTKKGRTFSAKFTYGWAPQAGERLLRSINGFISDTLVLDQFSTLQERQDNWEANFQFSEPLGESGRLLLSYQASYQEEESDVQVYDFSTNDLYDNFNANLSNLFSSDQFQHRWGGAFSYKKNDWRLMNKTEVQWARLAIEQRLPNASTAANGFWNILPMAVINYRPSSSKNFRLLYRMRTRLPDIGQLQNVLDNSNPLQLSIGNPELTQSLQHNFFARYSRTITEKSAAFFFLLSGSFINDQIVNSTYQSAVDYDPELAADARLVIPVNLDGYYNLRTYTTYGFPIHRLQSNLNLDFSATHTRRPGLINEERNNALNTQTGIGCTFSSNFSEQFDFTFALRSNYNFVSNSLQTASNNNFFNQQTQLKFNWIRPRGLVFRTELMHDFYDGLEDSFNQNFLLLNISLGKKLFQKQRGEISLTVFDLLRQNNALGRQVAAVSITDTQTNALQQYFLLSFRYDVRHFRKQG